MRRYRTGNKEYDSKHAAIQAVLDLNAPMAQANIQIIDGEDQSDEYSFPVLNIIGGIFINTAGLAENFFDWSYGKTR